MLCHDELYLSALALTLLLASTHAVSRIANEINLKNALMLIDLTLAESNTGRIQKQIYSPAIGARCI